MTLVQTEPKKIAMMTGGAAPRLPVEYQEVEYIESSRTQVINTGVFPTTQTYTAELEIESTQSGQEYWAFGIWGSTGFRAGQDSSGHWDTTYGASYDPSTYALNTKTKVTVSNSGKGVSGTTALGLFGMGESGSYSDARKGAYKMYYCKIWNSGTLIRDFVPCYRKLDSVIGMYDLVNDQFYTNIGTGTFTKGADVGGGEILIKKVMMRPGGVEKQIRPAGWQPGANTQIYYKFDGNLNDDSGNNRNATAGGTVSYGTNYVDLTNGYLTVPNITYSNPTTFVFRVKRNSTTNGAFFDSQTSITQIMRMRYDNSGSKIECYTDIPSFSNWKVLMSSSDTNWHLITIVAGPSNVIYYLDTVQKDTSSAWTGSHTATYTKIGTRSNLSTKENPAMYAGYFIVENKARTVDEITSYYNQTKGTYGL